MTSITKQASLISEYLSRELQLGDNDRETLRYGIEIIIDSIIKALVVISLSLWLDIFPQVMAALVTSSVLRLLSGGVHCNKFSHCLIFGAVIAVLTAKLSVLLGVYISLNILLVLIIATFLAGLYFVTKWAPADSPGKPITRPDKIKQFRRWSLIYVFIWFLTVTAALGVTGLNPLISSVILASITGFWVQITSLSPVGYRWVAVVDQILNKIIP